MSRKSRNNSLSTGLVFILCGLFSSALWAGNFPLPDDTRQVKQEQRVLGKLALEVNYCVSGLAPEQVRGFYRERLPADGWQELDLPAEAKAVPNLEPGPAAEEAFSRTMVFSRKKKDASEELIITFLPQEDSSDGKTRFSVTYGKNVFEGEGLPDEEEDFMPRLLAKPKRDIAPVYPGAVLVTLSEDKNTSLISYATKDEPEPVLDFYRQKMADYGWELQEEIPGEEKEAVLPKTEEAVAAAACRGPGCPANPLAKVEALKMRFVDLEFTNAKGEACRVEVSNVRTAKDIPDPLVMTSIMVHYEKKRA